MTKQFLPNYSKKSFQEQIDLLVLEIIIFWKLIYTTFLGMMKTLYIYAEDVYTYGDQKNLEEHVLRFIEQERRKL